MKGFITVSAACGLVLSWCAFASAHGAAHTTLMGNIHAVVATEIIVITTDDKYVPVALRPSTRYVTTRDEKGTWTDLRDGTRVVIKLDVDGRIAEEVRYRPDETSTPDSGGEGDE